MNHGEFVIAVEKMIEGATPADSEARGIIEHTLSKCSDCPEPVGGLDEGIRSKRVIRLADALSEGSDSDFRVKRALAAARFIVDRGFVKK